MKRVLPDWLRVVWFFATPISSIEREDSDKRRNALTGITTRARRVEEFHPKMRANFSSRPL
jgi:hypothetical protein